MHLVQYHQTFLLLFSRNWEALHGFVSLLLHHISRFVFIQHLACLQTLPFSVSKVALSLPCCTTSSYRHIIVLCKSKEIDYNMAIFSSTLIRKKHNGDSVFFLNLALQFVAQTWSCIASGSFLIDPTSFKVGQN